jgi:FkbM family methyltransferase
MLSRISIFIKLSQNILEKMGVRLIRTNEYYDYKSKVGKLSNYQRWAQSAEYPFLQSWIITNMENSSAQLQQDLVAAHIFNKPGYFVEFGATNGIDLSNTYLLEKEYKWNGILAEPGRNWHKALSENRRSLIDHRAVTGKSGEHRNFLEALEGEYSTLEEYSPLGFHQHTREKSEQYVVNTVSLNDLLDLHGAPSSIELISIDTEGSELEILENFNFKKYKVGLFFIEHNYSKNKDAIDDILKINGYVQFLPDVSQFDGWYLHKENLELLR